MIIYLINCVWKPVMVSVCGVKIHISSLLSLHLQQKTEVDIYICNPHISPYTLIWHIFPLLFLEESFSPASCKPFLGKRYGGGDPIPLNLLIPKSKLVSMRNQEECVSLTFFVECICTSCSSNLKQSTASLIESSPWRLLSGAQVSPKKQHVHMNAANDHMFWGCWSATSFVWSPC